MTIAGFTNAEQDAKEATEPLLFQSEALGEILSGGMAYLAQDPRIADHLRDMGAAASACKGGIADERQAAEMLSEAFKGALPGARLAIVAEQTKCSEDWAECFIQKLSDAKAPIDRISLASPAVGETVADHVAAGLGLEDLSIGSALSFNPFVPLDDPPRPDFPIDALPAWLLEFCIETGRALQVPVDFVAMATIGALSTVRAKRTVVECSEGYREPTNLYLAIIAAPGERKSATFAKASQPIHRMERESAKALAHAIEMDRQKVEAFRKRVENLRGQLAKAKDPGEEATATSDLNDAVRKLREAEESATVAPQYTGDDATPEAVAALLAENGERFALWSPEGGEQFEIMLGRYSANKRANLGIYLKGHAGDAHTVHRRSSEKIALEAPALSICMALQPSVLDDLRQARSLRGRGLLGRFFWSFPPSALGGREPEAAPLPAEVEKRYDAQLERLNRAPAGRVLTLSSEARRIRNDFARELEPRLGLEGDLAGISDFAGKLVGLVARLAGLLHEADHAGRDGLLGISGETMARAVELGRYALGHALYVFAEIQNDERQAAALKIWRSVARLGRGILREPLSARDLFQRVKGGRIRTMTEFEPAARLLVEHGYLADAPQRRGYAVNPEAIERAERAP